jgi:hypothetical protein
MPRLITEDPSMKRKMIAVLFLVGICLAVLVLEGVSQPPATPTAVQPSALTAPPQPVSPIVQPVPPLAANPAAIPATVEAPRQQEWSFEQLVEALKSVRARQKELKGQEAELLAKIAEKVEEKRKDLGKAEELLQQLRSEPSAHKVSSFDRPMMEGRVIKRFEEKKEDEKK